MPPSLVRLRQMAAPRGKRFKLYTAPTPNGHQASVMLEELKAAYGPKMDYDVEKLDLFGGEKPPQKEPWFLAMNPNGRIPVLTDRSRGNFHVFESAAILLYLAEHYDSNYHLWFDPVADAINYSQMLQWLFFAKHQHASIAPIQGQAFHFQTSAPEKIPYAINREQILQMSKPSLTRITGFQNEVERVYGVLDNHLTCRAWLAGNGQGKYSLAEIKAFPWIRRHSGIGIPTLDKWPNLKAWLARAEAKPAAKIGLGVPA